MKTIRNWSDLKQFGIDCLTGEACALSARGLCDLTEQGADNVREFLGLLPEVPHGAIFQDAWNSGAKHSCFLPWDILPSLSAFLLVKAGCSIVYHVKADGLYGIEPDDDQGLVANWLTGQDIVRQYKGLSAPRAGLSCTHQMSGRSQ